MNKFVQAITNMDHTENGALRYKSTYNRNLDFFALAGAQRDYPYEALQLFKQAFVEDPNLAIKNLFYARDIRGGQGVRSVFRECMSWLLSNDDRALKLLQFIPEYGYWKDLFSFYQPFANRDIDRVIEELVHAQLVQDKNNMENGKSISLCAKWFPLANNTKNPEKKKLAKSIAKRFGSPAIARKTISMLREYINVTERNVCTGKYENIDYSKVPSKSMMRNATAFRIHDGTRYNEYLEQLKSGNSKINTRTLYPFEVIRKYITDPRDSDELTELLWKNLPDYTNGNNAICMVDVSGSMTCNGCKPLMVAVSLGLYFAERNNSAFKNHFLTFSERPTMESINPEDSLFLKVCKMQSANWGMNTDIDLAFYEILKMARAKRVPKKDMPKVFYIISDMEFDQASCGVTNFNSIRNQYAEFGYDVPHLVFWNVNARSNAVPIDDMNNKNVTLVSGYSPVIFKYVLENKSPLEFMEEVLYSPRYAPLENVF